MIWTEIVAILIGFTCGSIMFGTIVAKVGYKKNIKLYGSKNPGATNVGRTLGKLAGLLTFLLDSFKGALAIGIILILKTSTNEFSSTNIYIAGLGAVLGHCFSPLEKFQGGKGVSTSLAVMCFISPFFAPIIAVVWLGSVFLTSYVSVGSIMFAATMLTVGVSIPNILQENLIYADLNLQWSLLDYKIVICVIIGINLLIIIKHHANIGRLLNGTERKVTWLKYVNKFLKRK